MSFIPEQELQKQTRINLAPMVDLLFLLLAVFACSLITKTTLKHNEIDLIHLHNQKTQKTSSPNKNTIHLSVSSLGDYQWFTNTSNYKINNIETIKRELATQLYLGTIPQDKDQTQILLHIDKKATWNSIAKLIFAVKDMGFTIYPVYEEKISS